GPKTTGDWGGPRRAELELRAENSGARRARYKDEPPALPRVPLSLVARTLTAWCSMTRLVVRPALVIATVLAAACHVARPGGPMLGPNPDVRPPGQLGPIPIAGPVRIQSVDRMLVRRGDLSAVVEDLNPPLVRTYSLTTS